MTSTAEGLSNDRDSNEKAALESRKLELEIRDLQRKWWQKPAYLQILLPVCIALISAGAALLIAYTNGFFDSQRAKLR